MVWFVSIRLVYAATWPMGDLAPINDADKKLNAADAVILQRFIIGDLVPTQTQKLIGDVAPLGSPDGQINAGDLVVLIRAIDGEITLPDVYIGPDSPALDAVTSPTNDNPYIISGSGEANTEIRLYVNGNLVESAASGIDGSFSFSVALFDGVNLIHATAFDGSIESEPSEIVSVEYQNNISKTQGGSISQDTVWTPGDGSPYVITDNLIINSGARFTLQPGVELRFSSGSYLGVSGVLTVNGTATEPAIITSNDSLQAGSWQGIKVQSGSIETVIKGCVVEYAVTAISLNAGSVLDCEVKNNTVGIAIGGAGLPVIQSSDIYQNDTGITLLPDLIDPSLPNPKINQNNIYNNTSNFVAIPSFLPPEKITVVNARNNWWGDTDSQVIADSISDFADPPGDGGQISKTLVDFGIYHDEFGDIYNSNQLYVVSDSQNLQSGVTYQVLGNIYILNGAQLTIPAGADLAFNGGWQWYIDNSSQVTIKDGVNLEFPSDYEFLIEGKAIAAGIDGSPVTMTSQNNEPTSWVGIKVQTGGSLSLDYANIRWAKTGVEATASNLVINQSVISDYSQVGIKFAAASTGSIQASTIDAGAAASSRSGAYIDDASPQLLGNIIRNNEWGIQIRNSAAPDIGNGNEISLNDYGVYVTGTGLVGGNPTPIVTGNWIHSNSMYNYYADNFYDPSVTTLDATLNRWDSDFVTEIDASIFDAIDNPASSPTVEYRPIDYVMSPPRLDAMPPYTTTAGFSLSGVSGPSLAVDIYVNGALGTTTTANTEGVFTATVSLSLGANEIHAIARRTDTGEQSDPSASGYISYDAVAPSVVVENPPDGSVTNQWEQTIDGYLTEAGTLTINGASVPVDASYRFSYGLVTLSEGGNSFLLEMTDLASNVATSTLTVILDTTSELSPELLTYAEDTAGNITVTGSDGSTSAGSEITLVNDRTGETVSVYADASGAFALVIGGAEGDHISVLTRDDLGNSSDWSSYTVQTAAPTPVLNVHVDSPLDGATIQSPYTSVSGLVEGPTGVGVVVNGHLAIIKDGRYYANDVYLETGSNDIVVTAVQPDGTYLQQTITVTRPAGEDFAVDLSPVEGAAPLDIELSVDGLNIQAIYVDYKSDGITDDSVSGTTFQASHRYSSEGIYTIDITVIDNSGMNYRYQPYVVVTTLEAMSAQRRQPYLSMLDRLGASDVDGALPYLTGGIRSRFQTLFEALGANLPTAITTLGVIQGGMLGDDFTEFYVARDNGTEKRVYPIYLIRSEDGVWRIGAM